MTGQTYLKRRGAAYYARMPVPFAIQSALGGKRELQRSLRTNDPTEARERLPAVIAEWRVLFAKAQPRRRAQRETIHVAGADHYRAELERDDGERAALPSTVDVFEARQRAVAEARERGIDPSDALALIDASLEATTLAGARSYRARARDAEAKALREHVVTGETALVADEARAFLAGQGAFLGEDDPLFVELCQRLARARLEALQRADERDRGDYSGRPSDPVVQLPAAPVAPAAPPTERLLALFDRYERENPRAIKPGTLRQQRDALALFLATIGEEAGVDALTRRNARDWKGVLLEWPVKATEATAFKGMHPRKVIEANRTIGKPAISHKTVNRHLSGLSAFADWLVHHDYLAVNPLTGMLLTVDKYAKKTDSFTVDQLRTVFAGGLFTSCANEKDWHLPGDHAVRDHRYWVPLVMLYSGARPAEIAQLTTADVREVHGHHVMHFTDRGDDQSLKTAGSARVVPVHSELVRLGFLAHVDAQRGRGETRVFPEATRNANGQMIAEFSRAFPRYLARIGVRKGRGLSLYSFRHTFIDALRRAEYLDDQFAFLVGHDKPTTTGIYGQLPQGMLRQRVQMVEAVDYPGLEIAPA